MTDDLRERALQIDALGSAIARGGSALGNVPALLRSVLETKAWQEFITKMGEHVTPPSFEHFVTEQPLAGLGADMALVKRLCSGETDLLDLIDQETKKSGGRPAKETVNNINSSRPEGTSKQQALRKLREDAPELHAEVLANRLSAHAAMVQAGFRPKTATVRLDDPERLAQSLVRKLDPDDLRALVKYLSEAVDG